MGEENLRKFIKNVENGFDVRLEAGDELKVSDVKDKLLGYHDWVDSYILISKSGIRIDLEFLEDSSEPVKNSILKFFGFPKKKVSKGAE